MNYEQYKEIIDFAVKENHNELIALNDDLADNPEIADEEFESSRKIVELLRKHGYTVEYPFDGIATAFKAVYGEKRHTNHAVLLTEYDALPDVGHACGHCVSGSISILTGLALKDLQDELDCDIDIIGTPAEEADGSKCKMVKDGVFDDYNYASMIHLYDKNMLYCRLFALDSLLFTFHGKAAHGATAPWDGINALNAAQLFMHAVDCMRQHVTPDVRMHAIYRNGGTAPNVVPEIASVEIYTRSLDRNYLNGLNEKVLNMAKGACLMTGATFEVEPTAASYDSLKLNETGLKALKEAYDELGIEIYDAEKDLFGSSDAANVSFVCPTFHPTLKIAPEGTAIHTREFEQAVRTDIAHESIATGAKALAYQIVKIFSDPEKVKQLKADFK